MKNLSVFIDSDCSKTCEKLCTKNQIVGCQNPLLKVLKSLRTKTWHSSLGQCSCAWCIIIKEQDIKNKMKYKNNIYKQKKSIRYNAFVLYFKTLIISFSLNFSPFASLSTNKKETSNKKRRRKTNVCTGPKKRRKFPGSESSQLWLKTTKTATIAVNFF